MGTVLRAHVDRELAATDAPQPPGLRAARRRVPHPARRAQRATPCCERYLSEVIWRCALILAVHGRDHDQRGSVAEHQRLVELMAARDVDGAEALIAQHVAAVEERTLAGVGPEGHLDLTAVLSRY